MGGRDITRLSGDELAAYRRSTVGFVFQHFGLLDTLSAAENVELATTLAGTSRADRRARAAELLASVDLSERAGHRPAALSGGERQRWPSPGPWPTAPACCWQTSPLATWTARPRHG